MRPSTDEQRDATGLLDEIAANALDDDYYAVHPPQERRSRTAGALLAVVLVVFALLVTTAAVQTRNDRPGTELERRTLAADIQDRQKVLESRRAAADRLRGEVDELRSSTGGRDPEMKGVGVLTAARAATGPGVVVNVAGGPEDVVGGQVTDNDLQILVNGLWYAGAEAIAINGHRLGSLSAIRSAGAAITVNYRDIGPPYTVIALGNADTLANRFAQNPSGAYWEERRKRSGVEYAVTRSSDVTVPAAPAQRLDLKNARALEEDG